MKPFCNQKQFDQMKRIKAREFAERLRQQGAAITTGDRMPTIGTGRTD